MVSYFFGAGGVFFGGHMEKKILTQKNIFWRFGTSIPVYRVDLRPKNRVHLAIKHEFLSKNNKENVQIWELAHVPGV